MAGDDTKAIKYLPICSEPMFETPMVVEGIDLSCLPKYPIW